MMIMLLFCYTLPIKTLTFDFIFINFLLNFVVLSTARRCLFARFLRILHLRLINTAEIWYIAKLMYDHPQNNQLSRDVIENCGSLWGFTFIHLFVSYVLHSVGGEPVDATSSHYVFMSRTSSTQTYDDHVFELEVKLNIPTVIIDFDVKSRTRVNKPSAWLFGLFECPSNSLFSRLAFLFACFSLRAFPN